MADAFLSSLPHVRTDTLGDEDQQCPICMEDYGGAPSARGIVDRAVKLPCNHIMGYECISTWVSAPARGGGGNNTCPICRHVFFPMRVRRQWHSSEHLRIHGVLRGRCGAICLQIGCGSRVSSLATGIADSLHDSILLETQSFGMDAPFHAIAAASVFMASHLCGDARSLERVSSCVGDVDLDAVRRTYVLIFSHRFNIVVPELASNGLDVVQMDARLPRPSSLAEVPNPS